MKNSGFSMSFLDVLCSAMGGVVVLAVIFSLIKNPVIVPKRGEFILIEVEAQGKPALGLTVRTPEGHQYALVPMQPIDLPAAEGGVTCTQGHTAKQTRFYVEIRNPQVGSWQLRPYLVNWEGKDFKNAKINAVRVWTRNGLLTGPKRSAPKVSKKPTVAGAIETLPSTGRRTGQTFQVQIGDP